MTTATARKSANEIVALFAERITEDQLTPRGDQRVATLWLSVKQTAWLAGQYSRETRHSSDMLRGQHERGYWEVAISPRNGCGLLRMVYV